MVAELRRQSPLGSRVCVRRFMGRLRPWARYGRTMATCRIRLTAGGLGQKFRPDRYDLAGTLAGSVGVVVIMFAAGTGMSTKDRKALVHRLWPRCSMSAGLRYWMSCMSRRGIPSPGVDLRRFVFVQRC